MIELKGKLIADRIKEEVSSKLEKAPSSYELAIIRIGDNNDQVTYENSAKKKLSEAGINVKSYVFDSNISNDQFYENFKQINSNDNVKGILLLKPLPSNIDEIRIAETIITNELEIILCVSYSTPWNPLPIYNAVLAF